MVRTKGSHGGFMRAMGILLVLVVIAGLAALVAYLLSDINHRRFRTSQKGDVLVVEQGRFFPVGFADFEADTDTLAQAYRPIELPPHENVGQSIVFDDRAALDRALFTLLSGWARLRLDAPDAPTLALATAYVRRAEMLPAIAEEQRQQLRALRADASFRQAEGIVLGIAAQLRQAEHAYQLAIDLGTAHAAQARVGLASARDKLRLLGDSKTQPGDMDVVGAPP